MILAGHLLVVTLLTMVAVVLPWAIALLIDDLRHLDPESLDQENAHV